VKEKVNVSLCVMAGARAPQTPVTPGGASVLEPHAMPRTASAKMAVRSSHRLVE